MSFVTTEIQDAVAVLTIDRPKALNALNPEVLADLKAAFEAIDQNTVRCVVLTGAGDKSFVAGADIGSMSTMTKAEGEAFGKLGNDVFLMIESFPLPVIAAVNGFALGGGNELAMSCDIRLCSDNAVFGQPEVGLGITPGFGGTQRLARLVGIGMAVFGKNRHEHFCQFLVGHFLQIFMVEPFAFFEIEFCAALRAVFEREELNEFVHRHDFLVVTRIPSEKGKEVDDSFRQIAGFTVA